MFSRRRLVALFDRRLVRRLVLVPLVLGTAIITIPLSPLLVALAYGRDVVRRDGRRSRTRLSVLIIGAVGIEALAMIASLGAWLVTGFGLLGPARWRWQIHRWHMGRYTSVLLRLITWVLGVGIEWRDGSDLSVGPVVMVARHTSFFDALIPATVLSRRNQLLAHHVVTHGLRYAPCIDIVGHRFPNRFIKRTPGEGSAELDRIREIGGLLDDRSSAIIFPEGTFRNDARFERVLRRLRRREPELAARAETLRHVLPPRASGTYALLVGAPTADLVVCTNTGFEAFGSLRSIIDAPSSDHNVIIETWRIPRSEIPDDPADFAAWLFNQYVEIDDWVSDANGALHREQSKV